MKKALALVMAIAMVASLAAVSFAATAIDPVDGNAAVAQTVILEKVYVEREDVWTDLLNEDDDAVRFGETVYIRLQGADGESVTDVDAVKGLKVDAKWTKNGDYIKSVELVKTKVDSTEKLYAIAIATTGSSLSEVTVEGEIAVKGKTYFTNGDEKESATIKETFDVTLDLAYETEDAPAAIALDDGDKIVYDFEDVVDDEYAVDFGGKVLVEADVKNMKKVLFAYNEDASEELLDAYVDANLDFYNCTGSFRRTAEVTVDLADDEYFYQVVDGKLVAVDGEYDDWTEEFTFKTRTMGNYVISDMELVTEEVAVANPSTGAAA